MAKLIRPFLSAFGFMLVVSSLAGTVSAADIQVPELDPGSIGSALTLASGAFFMLRGRRSSK